MIQKNSLEGKKMNDVEKALKIAKKAHAGQIDKAGCEYINHPIHVADSLNAEEEKIVAYLQCCRRYVNDH